MTTIQSEEVVLAEGTGGFILRSDGGFLPSGDMKDVVRDPVLTVNGKDVHAGRTWLQPEDLPITSCSLSLQIDYERANDLAASAGIHAENLHVAITIDEPLLARREVIAHRSLDDWDSAQVLNFVPIPDAMSGVGGLTLRIVLLAQGLSARPLGDAIEEGAWLAITKFELRPTPALLRFAPTPLTEGVRKTLKLPKDVLSHVQVMDDVLEADMLSEVVELYIDDELLRLLGEDPDSPTSFTFQIMFANQTITAVLNEISMRALERGVYGLSESELQASAAGRLLKLVADVAGLSPGELITKVQGNPAQASTFVQQFVGARKKTLKAVKEMR